VHAPFFLGSAFTARIVSVGARVALGENDAQRSDLFDSERAAVSVGAGT
jgi:hypothetical protein